MNAMNTKRRTSFKSRLAFQTGVLALVLSTAASIQAKPLPCNLQSARIVDDEIELHFEVPNPWRFVRLEGQPELYLDGDKLMYWNEGTNAAEERPSIQLSNGQLVWLSEHHFSCELFAVVTQKKTGLIVSEHVNITGIAPSVKHYFLAIQRSASKE